MWCSLQEEASAREIIEKLERHIWDISYRTYFRKRQMAIDALSSMLSGIRQRRVWHCWRRLRRNCQATSCIDVRGTIVTECPANIISDVRVAGGNLGIEKSSKVVE